MLYGIKRMTAACASWHMCRDLMKAYIIGKVKATRNNRVLLAAAAVCFINKLSSTIMQLSIFYWQAGLTSCLSMLLLTNDTILFLRILLLYAKAIAPYFLRPAAEKQHGAGAMRAGWPGMAGAHGFQRGAAGRLSVIGARRTSCTSSRRHNKAEHVETERLDRELTVLSCFYLS